MPNFVPVDHDPFATDQASPPGLTPVEGDPFATAPSVGADVIKSGGTGLAKGLIAAAGLPGDAANMLTKGSKAAGDYIGGLFGQGESPEPTGPLLPTSAGIQKGIESKTGEFYQPQTTAGKFTGAAAEALGNPLSYVGPGGVLGKLGAAAATGLGSEAAGQAAHAIAPELEPAARIAGGLLGGVGAGAISAGTANAMRARGIPTTQELQTASNQAYSNARNLGVEYTPSNLVLLRDQINRDLLKQGHRADKSGGTLSRIEELPFPLTPGNPNGNRNFSDIEGVRQSLNEIRDEINPLTGKRTADARAAGIAINHIDKFLEDPTKAVLGHQVIAAQAAQFAKEGRANWAAMSRSMQIEQALEKSGRNAAATGSGANIDNALRQQVKNILNNPRRAKNFTADDRAIMEDIVAGNPVRNSARLIGKMAATGIVSAAGTEYLSSLMGLGGFGHVGVLAAGYAAKKAGDIMTRNRYSHLLQNIRMESPLGRSRTIPPPENVSPYAIRSALTMPSSPYVGPNLGPLQSKNPYAQP